MKLNINNIDIRKADLGLGHEYVPQTDWNLELTENERVSVECEYFKVGEKARFMVASADGTAAIDLAGVFSSKVKEIRGLSINGEDITTAKKLLSYPSIPELETMMMDVVLHILKADSLTEDESKN